jgi:hypothetical protein
VIREKINSLNLTSLEIATKQDRTSTRKLPFPAGAEPNLVVSQHTSIIDEVYRSIMSMNFGSQENADLSSSVHLNDLDIVSSSLLFDASSVLTQATDESMNEGEAEQDSKGTFGWAMLFHFFLFFFCFFFVFLFASWFFFL